MALDEKLVDRIRELINSPGVEEKKMFGGLAFLVGGHMSVAASGKGGLLLRVEPDETQTLLLKPHTKPMVMQGRPLKGWLRVAPEGLRTKKQLEAWVQRGVEYARSMPAKTEPSRKRKAASASR